MAVMKTDAATLAREAQSFDRIAGELKASIGRVESTASDLQPAWHGQAGLAAQAALQRFHEAANKQILELNQISTNISSAGMNYSRADDDQSSSLASQMNF
ncbi:WXG100 family type VII secretion target [Mycobacterium spongiae]|uniref:ESAT-6-like protein n=1 Tax=Mycobacterium spongiae TaxID=886343 RepID=A0A975JVL9_9MYCO|nr:WXG100 family type VII secretion target [Mycobacterium spongiae]QUR66519.1 WXG100 family type VII secretion target [Mycobacterium spongiae]